MPNSTTKKRGTVDPGLDASERATDEGMKKLCGGIGRLHWRMLSRAGRARHGVLHLKHGEVHTPVFMPVGTQGTDRDSDAHWELC